MLVTELNYGECYKFSQWELNKFPGLSRSIFMHCGDHSLDLGVPSKLRKRVTPRVVMWRGHEDCDVDVVMISDKDLYEVSPDLLQ